MRSDVQRPALLLLLALALALAACGGDDDEPVPGGAEAVPGPLPSGVAFAEPAAGGVPAPELTAELLDGSELTAGDLWADRPVVVFFTASWCETCKDVDETVRDVAAEHEGAVNVLAVVPADDADGAADYAQEAKLDHPVAVGAEQVWLDYAAREPPVVVLVAPGGTVLRGWPGGVDADVLAEQLDGLFAGSTDGRR